MKFKKYLIKTLTVIAGSIISAYGITLAIGAGFGGATLAILWQGLTNVTGMTIGTSSLVVAAAMIIFALFYDKKQINVGTILYQIIYSFFVDVFTKIQHYTDIKAVNFIIMLLGIIIFSFGTGLYSAADFGRGSYEAVTFSLSEKNGWKILKTLTNHPKLSEFETLKIEEVYDKRNVEIEAQLNQIFKDDNFNYSVWYKNGLHNVYVYYKNSTYEYEYFDYENKIVLKEIENKKYKR